MLREIRKMKSQGKAKWIRALQWRGKLSVLKNEQGYLCYDPEELRNYQKNTKRGRPPKIKETKKQ